MIYGLSHGRALDHPNALGAPLTPQRQHTRWIWAFLAACAAIGGGAAWVGQQPGGLVLGLAIAALGLGGLTMAWSDARERLIHDGAIVAFVLGAILWRSQLRPVGASLRSRLFDVGTGVVEGLILALLLWGLGWVVARWKARQMDTPDAPVLALGEGDPPILFAAALGFGLGAGVGVMLGGAVCGMLGWALVHRRHPEGHIPLVTHFMLALVLLLVLRAVVTPLDPVASAPRLLMDLWSLWAPLWPATLR